MGQLRFYCPDLQPGTVTLSVEESRHAAVSLRARTGDEVRLVDGRGREGSGRIAQIQAKRVIIDVQEIVERDFECPLRCTVAVGFGKAHRQSYLIEKCTELGAAAFWPVVTERSVSRPGAAAIEKWRRRAVEAAKQAGRAWIPTVDQTRTMMDALRGVPSFDTAVLAHPNPDAPSVLSFFSRLRVGSAVLVFIGPEGGWSESELQEAQSAGVNSTSIGSTILRVETAAVVVCAAAALCRPSPATPASVQ